MDTGGGGGREWRGANYTTLLRKGLSGGGVNYTTLLRKGLRGGGKCW